MKIEFRFFPAAGADTTRKWKTVFTFIGAFGCAATARMAADAICTQFTGGRYLFICIVCVLCVCANDMRATDTATNRTRPVLVWRAEHKKWNDLSSEKYTSEDAAWVLWHTRLTLLRHRS